MSDTAVQIVRVCLLGSNVLGTFGNLSIIIATYRTKELRNKYGKHRIQLFGTALCICLLFPSGDSYSSPSYFLFERIEKMLQVYMILLLSIDRNFAIQFPISEHFNYRYRNMDDKPYILFSMLPGVVIASFFVVSVYSLKSLLRSHLVRFRMLALICSYFDLQRWEKWICVSNFHSEGGYAKLSRGHDRTVRIPGFQLFPTQCFRYSEHLLPPIQYA
uniref:G_PROTEIN_RECEP_F1_2 domain-containing protein n=1 Tax=Heterorhabditis bacteriophora TaxID=37862 RepID=A0A1I7WAK6_HETBA